MQLNGKVVDLLQLQGELTAAGVPYRGLGQSGDILHTYTVAGAPTDIPVAGYAVVDAHIAPPPPPSPDYGNDDSPRAQLADQVSSLRQYLALATPTNAQTISAFKIIIHIVLFILRGIFR